jgi:hypothetical protein
MPWPRGPWLGQLGDQGYEHRETLGGRCSHKSEELVRRLWTAGLPRVAILHDDLMNPDPALTVAWLLLALAMDDLETAVLLFSNS